MNELEVQTALKAALVYELKANGCGAGDGGEGRGGGLGGGEGLGQAGRALMSF